MYNFDKPIMDYLYENFDSEIIEEYLMLWDGIEDTMDIVIESLEVDYKNSINELFRAIHTLKSGSAFLGIKIIESFCHFVESILDEARKKKIEGEKLQKLIDWLFLVSDQLHKWYEDLEKNNILSSVNSKILKVPNI